MSSENQSNDQMVSVSREIAASPEAIFDILADPARHAEFDGSDTVVGSKDTAPTRLSMGATFGMSMRMGIPYPIKNTVVEFEENARIAWRHLGRHRWRYELEPTDGATLVTETFDWSTAFSPWVIERMGYPKKHVPNMERSLERLEALVTSGEPLPPTPR